jgi:hypothetical protein
MMGVAPDPQLAPCNVDWLQIVIVEVLSLLTTGSTAIMSVQLAGTDTRCSLLVEVSAVLAARVEIGNQLELLARTRMRWMGNSETPIQNASIRRS